MDVVVDFRPTPAALQLTSHDDMKSFRVVVLDGAPISDTQFDAAGMLGHEEHVWVPISLLMNLAGTQATAEWRTGLEAMVQYATSNGWYEAETAAIRAHCVREFSASFEETRTL